MPDAKAHFVSAASIGAVSVPGACVIVTVLPSRSMATEPAGGLAAGKRFRMRCTAPTQPPHVMPTRYIVVVAVGGGLAIARECCKKGGDYKSANRDDLRVADSRLTPGPGLWSL